MRRPSRHESVRSLSHLISLRPQHRRKQPAQVSAEDEFFRGVWDVSAEDLSELRSETPAPDIAPIDHPFGTEFPHCHFHEPRRWIRSSNLRRHILRVANDADAPLPVSARADAVD